MLTRYWGIRPATARAFVASTARAGIVAAFVAATIGCGSDATEATAPANANVASIELPTLSTALLAGDTLHLAAVARDAQGRVLSGVDFIWSSSDSALVEVESAGRLTSRGHGSVVISATAGGARATTTVQTRLTAEERRFAYARVDDPSASAAYLPTSSFQHNETGGRILVAHRATGDYTVTFERMAKVDSAFRETVLVSPYGAAGERCHLNGWNNAANGRDLDLTIVTTLHDLTLAGRYPDTLAMLAEGRLVALGAPRDVLTVEIIEHHYGTPVRILHDDDGGIVVVPTPRLSRR